MGFWDFLRGGSGAPGHMLFSPNVEYIGGTAWSDVAELAGIDSAEWTAAQMWRTQPHLRTVVSFLARNVAQLGLQTFERVDEVDRRRDRKSPVALALKQPDETMTAYDLVFSLVGDMALYDTAYWLITDRDGRPGIRRLPPSWVTEIRDDPFVVTGYRVRRGNSPATVDVPPEQIVSFNGYAPSSPGGLSPTVAALRETLQEQIEASRFRNQIWKRGGRVSSVLERPKDAPQWSDGARESFREDWYSKYTGRGSRAGGTPILEDGMTLKRIDFSAVDQQYVEGAKLGFATVAAAFHVNPTMVGQLDNANYSNVREFRRMLYGDTLGPIIAQIEDRINTFLLPRLGMDSDRFYTEFNIAEKLQGSFEEQAQVMQTLVGAPIMTRNEGRGKFNLPALAEGNQLVTPLNVLIGGQASPTDAGSQNLNPAKALGEFPWADSARLEIKAAPDENHRAEAQQILSAYFTRQERAVRSRLGAKSPAWWDEARWGDELSAVVLKLTQGASRAAGRRTAASLGHEGQYDEKATLAWLTAASSGIAGGINAATREQIEESLTADDPEAALTSVWAIAQSQRVIGAAKSVTSLGAGFGTVEAAKQINPETSKTWNTGKNPRTSHAALNGQTVPCGEPFSNGAQWPGDSTLNVDELAGCNCTVSINVS